MKHVRAIATVLVGGALAAAGCGADGPSPVATTHAALSAGCTPSATAPELRKRTINVAVSPLSPPYISADAEDPSKIVGFEADLMDAWSRCLGVRWKWQVYQDFGAMVPAVQSGRDDIVQSSVFATPERLKQIDFVGYMKSFTGSAVAKGDPQHLGSVGDLCGKRIVEVVGAVEVPIVKAQSAKCTAAGKPAVKLTLYKDNNLAIAQVRNGRADGFLVDAGLASILAKRFPDQLQTGFTIDSGLTIGTGVNKRQPQLRDAIATALTRLQDDGTIKRLLVKWGLSADQEIPVGVVHG